MPTVGADAQQGRLRCRVLAAACRLQHVPCSRHCAPRGRHPALCHCCNHSLCARVQQMFSMAARGPTAAAAAAPLCLAEYLPTSDAYEEAEALRKILKPQASYRGSAKAA